MFNDGVGRLPGFGSSLQNSEQVVFSVRPRLKRYAFSFSVDHVVDLRLLLDIWDWVCNFHSFSFVLVA